ncbi:MAG TPA: PAS domain-containing protein [Phenylobacterium sp.]|uniref:PAS domain-containing protein n=1 Tax=Phenylobacterium sp. TaxID=1871053 RepID=UPI002BF3E1E4|nr:PAS domain-containing protein [Phenylobacterium sp.]HXA38583.1 PAS domain-containing protein [Phenylobacterium sp.]
MAGSITLDVAEPAGFLEGGGELGRLIAGHDWSASLGPLAAWPESLKTTVGIVLHSQVPIVLLWGPDGIMIYNDAYSVFAARRHPGLLGAKVREGWPEVTDFNDNVMSVGLAGGTLAYRDQELTLYRSGRAEQVWMNLDYSPVIDESGRPGGVIAIVVETTDRVLADRRAAAEQARQRQLFTQMPGFVGVLTGPQHVYEYVNDAYIAIAGRSDFVGRTVREALPELEGQGFYELLDQVYATGERVVARGMELRLQGSAEVQYIDFVFEPIRDDVGQVSGIFIGGYEVTEVHRAAAAASASEARLREMNAELERKVIERTQARGRTWQVSPDLMGALNSTGYFETSNPAWKSMLGWSEEEVASMSIWELLHPDDLERTREGFALTQIGQPAIRFPNRYRCKDGGYRWISWVGVPEDGMVYCTGRDITEEKTAEAELAAAQDALRQSQKMEAVGQLTGGLAHDFNNLLAGISGSLEMVDKRLGEGRIGDVERYVAAAQSSARRAAALTQRLLAFSRRQTLDPRPTDLNRLIAGMEDLIRRTVGPTVEVEVVGSGGLWLTRIDRSQLENALLNLCLNGRDAMEPQGGRLTIETANKWLDARAAKARELSPGQYVSLSVTDTGAGIPQDVILRIFDPFFTTKPLGQGTGLGLSMTYGFVRQSGGQVRVYSEVGKGTTMCLYLPRFAGDAEAVEDELAPVAIQPGSGETVLVIDDEPTVRMLIVEVLEENGYAAIQAVDGATGLKVLQSDARIDLLITDVGLPGGLNGRQVADAARLTRADLKVLFITGYAENAVVGNGHLDPGMEVITKPFGMANLGAKIRSLIES